jgi:two-component system, chemotaxis family, chemotaxis protein CheY
MPFDTKMKVLIVDDMQTMRKILKNMMVKMGCTDVHEADDGIPALKLIQEAEKNGEPFKFVMSDWNMPGMTGLDLLKNLRSDEKFKKLPFLMITAEGEQANVITAVKAGVSNFVVKPFSINVLQEKINKIFP